MPYVVRNKEKEIVAIHPEKGKGNALWVDASNPEVIAFIKKYEASSEVRGALNGSDIEMVRVVEDLVDLLMEKQVFAYAELPEAVQAKLSLRKQLRQDMSSLGDLINDDEAIF